MKGLVTENKRIFLKDNLGIPTPKESEVLVKVKCASVNPTDLDVVKGNYDLWLKLSGGYHAVRTGLEFSGVIVEGAGNFRNGLSTGQKSYNYFKFFDFYG